MSAQRFRLTRRVTLGAGREEGRVLIDTYSGSLSACNDTAWAMLKTLESGGTLDDLAAVLCRDFEVSRARARGDAMGFLHRLVSMGLVDEQ